MVQKKSPSFFAGWQDRLLEVKNRTFTYSKVGKNGEHEVTGTLNFDFYECFINMEGSNQFTITFTGNDRKFEFKCKDENEAQEWF